MMTSTSTTTTTTTTSSNANGTTSTNHNNAIQRSPPTTELVIGICCGMYGVQTLFNISEYKLAFNPTYAFIDYNQYPRIVMHCLFHYNILHLAMNLLFGYRLLNVLEKQLGTIRLLLIILWSILLTPCTYIIIVFLLSIIETIIEPDKPMDRQSLGLSGILFHLFVLLCNTNSDMTQHNSSIVRRWITKLYPWIVLVLIQPLLPVQFLVHLSGIIVGTIQCSTKLFTTYHLLPTDASLTTIDNYILTTLLSPSLSSPRGSMISTLRLTYIRTTPTLLPIPTDANDPESITLDPNNNNHY